VVIDGTRASVRYDCVDEGRVIWTELVFHDLLSLRFRDIAACEATDVLGHDYIVEERSSSELGELVKRWEVFVGWQEYERRRVSTDPFKSYHIFFDDAAALEVVARSLEVVHPAQAP
jgi:hypothetical protein